MSETFRCDDKDMLVAYLFGEIEADGRREVERHLRGCPACSQEVDGLNAVRRDLQGWEPPALQPGIAIASRPAAAVLTSPRWSALRDLPVWAQIAAAALVMGVGASIANIQVRTTADGGVMVTTGWMAPAAPGAEAATTAAAVVPVTGAPAPDWRRELAASEQRLRDEIAVQQAAVRTATASTATAGAPPETAAVLRRVQSMIDASEERQRQELALRLTQVERNWNFRRTTDWAAISQRMSSLQGRTFVVEAGQQEMVNRLRRASLTPNQ